MQVKIEIYAELVHEEYTESKVLTEVKGALNWEMADDILNVEYITVTKIGKGEKQYAS